MTDTRNVDEAASSERRQRIKTLLQEAQQETWLSRDGGPKPGSSSMVVYVKIKQAITLLESCDIPLPCSQDKVKEGYVMECGHPVQHAYTTSRLGKGQVGCSMCDKERRIKRIAKVDKVEGITEEAYRAFVRSLQAPLVRGLVPVTNEEDVVLHGLLGLAGEIGELIEEVIHHLWYGKEYNKAHILEELGDVLHFMTYLMIEHKWTLQDVMDGNVAKLEKRYPDGFNTEDAIKRMDKQAANELKVCNCEGYYERTGGHLVTCPEYTPKVT